MKKMIVTEKTADYLQRILGDQEKRAWRRAEPPPSTRQDLQARLKELHSKGGCEKEIWKLRMKILGWRAQ